MQTDYLFVYGSLLKDYDSPMSKFLSTSGEFISSGYVIGKLYQIAWYPGAVLTNCFEEKVYGHVYKICNPLETFKILDAYEGIDNDTNDPDEFIRIIGDVFLNSNIEHSLKSWIYVYNFPIDNLKQIVSGNFLNP